VSAGLAPDISKVYNQIKSAGKKIKTLTAKFDAEVKGIADRITKKKIQADTELSLQREQQQLDDQAPQAQRAQEVQLLQNQLDAVLAQQDRFSRRHRENAHAQKQEVVGKLRWSLDRKLLKLQEDNFSVRATKQRDRMDQRNREEERRSRSSWWRSTTSAPPSTNHWRPPHPRT
jgi:hypothetical protein